MAKAAATLQQIPPDEIRKNPDNPRSVPRGGMNELLESIKSGGIRVPVSLYEDGDHYFLIDGERRWRCAKKLNFKAMPAIVQPKPTRLENILMMFNIHNVRVDWDPMPMALKLREVVTLLEKEGQPTNAKALAAVTGRPRSQRPARARPARPAREVPAAAREGGGQAEEGAAHHTRSVH